MSKSLVLKLTEGEHGELRVTFPDWRSTCAKLKEQLAKLRADLSSTRQVAKESLSLLKPLLNEGQGQLLRLHAAQTQGVGRFWRVLSKFVAVAERDVAAIFSGDAVAMEGVEAQAREEAAARSAAVDGAFESAVAIWREKFEITAAQRGAEVARLEGEVLKVCLEFFRLIC
jgi:hypothetical protein